ncbi:hypothetical protein B0H34DRAFT_736284 [Crassisporium funariophilum]|nr:hypothetical protein B0H34DRAFT_736284 [Crassisporium funariophilum]
MSPFSPFDLPDGIILLITDELLAPATFMLHRTLAAHMKRSLNSKCVILSVTEDITRWKALSAKSNLNLSHHLDSGSVDFIDISAQVLPISEGPNLLDIFRRVQSQLDKFDGENILVILDDITTLEWIGISSVDILRFSRSLRAACLKKNATLVIRHHIVTPNDPDDLFRHLLQISSHHLEVQPLASGRSGAVSGEISLHHGFSAKSDGVKSIHRNTAMQYRLTDSGPGFFERGTSGGVL